MDAKFEFYYGEGFLYFNSSLIIYTEQEYNKKINEYIQDHYDAISAMFAKYHKTFLYIPRLADIIDSSSLPYLTGRRDFQVTNPGNTRDALRSALPKDVFEKLTYPSLTFFDQTDVTGFRLDVFENPATAFCAFFESIKPRLLEKYYANYDIDTSATEEEEIRFRIGDLDEVDKAQIDQEINDREDNLTGKISKEEWDLIAQAKENVRLLLDKGLSIELIYRLIKPQLKLSRLVITKDYRIYMPDYDNLEIKLGPIDKTVFFFYLRHSEGVNFKDLIDYKDELKDIYKKVNHRMFAIFSPIDSLVDVTNNSINEKCSHIRRVFLANLAVPLANEYYIIGERGEDKRIKLDRSLVTWECEL